MLFRLRLLHFYTVLFINSLPRYNNHREQILRGSHTDFEDNSLDVFQYFTASCYKGFGDAPGQFYYVYSEVFEKLASEEIEYMKTPEEYENIPKFGKADSPYVEIVGPFYAYWQSFCTRKSKYYNFGNINK